MGTDIRLLVKQATEDFLGTHVKDDRREFGASDADDLEDVERRERLNAHILDLMEEQARLAAEMVNECFIG